MDLRLRGKAAIVMAASEGLGRGAATALAREGCRVGITARRLPLLKKAAAEIADETGAEVEAARCDVSKKGESARAIEALAKRFGALDVLVNNGGGPKPGAADAFSDDQWQDAFELLVLSNVRACRAALPHLSKRGGSIVNIVSTSVKQPLENLVLSNSLRLAVIGWAKTLSLAWAPKGIRVNNLLPGSMDTERIMEVVRATAQTEGIAIEDARMRRTQAIPLGRFGTTTEFGDAVAFLASPRSSYVTGQSWAIDGGVIRGVFG